MVGAAFASAPLDNWFCRTIGLGGTPRVAVHAPGEVLGRDFNTITLTYTFPRLPERSAPVAQTTDDNANTL